MATPTRCAPSSYGVEAGYSEEHAEEGKPLLYPSLDKTEQSLTGVYGTMTNKSALFNIDHPIKAYNSTKSYQNNALTEMIRCLLHQKKQ